jgi:hypothetical protein
MTDQTDKREKMRTLFFDNHLPIKIKGDWTELWLGYDYLDFGGRYVRAYKNRKGEYLLWYRRNSAYTDGRSYSLYLGKVRSGDKDVMALFPLLKVEDTEDYREDDRVYFCMEDRGKIQDWLDGLGLVKVEVFD